MKQIRRSTVNDNSVGNQKDKYTNKRTAGKVNKRKAAQKENRDALKQIKKAEKKQEERERLSIACPLSAAVIKSIDNEQERIYFDCETYSEQELKKVGSYRYAENCEILIYGIKHSSEPAEIVDSIPSNITLYVYNVNFESPVLDDPSIIFIDIQHKVAAHSLPLGLDKATKAIGLPEGQLKSKDGKHLIAKFSVHQIRKLKVSKSMPTLGLLGPIDPPAQVKILPRNTQNNSPIDWMKFEDYCKQDVVATQALDEALPDLNSSEQELAHLDLKINKAGIPIDILLVKSIIKLIDEYITDQVKRCKKLTGFAPSQTKMMMKYCEQQGYSLADYQAETIQKALDDPSTPMMVKTALQFRQNTSNTSLTKYKKMAHMVCADGCIRGTMQYHAASTGRWGGRGMQPQNFPRASSNINVDAVIKELQSGTTVERLVDKFGSFTDALKSCLRAMIYSEEGFTVVDYAGIEARVIQWLVNDQKALQVFRDGKDVYKNMASLIFGVPYEEVTSDQRFLGKQAILGLSYQMSADRFIETCASFGKNVSEKIAKRTVKTYREVHSLLIRYWKEIEIAAIKAVDSKQMVEIGRLKFKVKGKFLYMKLPSGRNIAYPFPKIETVDTQWGKKRQFTYLSNDGKRTSTYGGKLIENATQGIARDILADSLKRLDKEGYKIIFHVHDEVIIEGTYRPDDISQIMCDVEPWAEGNVIDAEGFNCQRYKKG